MTPPSEPDDARPEFYDEWAEHQEATEREMIGMGKLKEYATATGANITAQQRDRIRHQATYGGQPRVAGRLGPVGALMEQTLKVLRAHYEPKSAMQHIFGVSEFRDLVEAHLTTAWSNGFDEGYAQAKLDVTNALR